MCVVLEVAALGVIAFILRWVSKKFKISKLHFCSTCKEGKKCPKHSYIKLKKCGEWV